MGQTLLVIDKRLQVALFLDAQHLDVVHIVREPVLVSTIAIIRLTETIPQLLGVHVEGDCIHSATFN
jgi:hypothetical protein